MNKNILVEKFLKELKLLKKIQKKKKLLLVIIDKKNKHFYDSKKLNISLKTLTNLLNISKKQIEIADINEFSDLFKSGIEITPSYIYFEEINNKINVLWYGEGYFLPKK